MYPDHFKRLDVAASSICDARQKIGWQIFRALLQKVIELFENRFDKKYLWQGHRLFAVDGTKLNLPSCFKKIKYTLYGKQANYPTALVSILFRARALLPYGITFSRHTNEIKHAFLFLKKLRKNDVVIYDRGYLCLGLLKAHFESQIHAVFRLKTKNLREINAFIDGTELDQVITFHRKNFPPMQLRLIRYKKKGEVFYLATTLIDQEKYSRKSLIELYHERWGVEEQIKSLKEHVNLITLHSHTTSGVKQELYVFCLLFAISRVSSFFYRGIKKAKKKQKNRVFSSPAKLKPNMSQAISNLVTSLIRLQTVDCKDVQNSIWDIYLNEIDQGRNRTRPGRAYPRCSKLPVNKFQKNRQKRLDAFKKQTRQQMPP